MEVERDLKIPCIGKIVLVVDDTAVIRREIAAAFLSDGFKTCIEAGNGREAIEAATKSQPDLVILDLSMPIMNGLQSAPHLRKILPQIPIILFTLYGNNLSQADALRAGITLVLEKSAPLSMLVKKARELMES